MNKVTRKAIFFDIDGTISAEDTGMIPESAIKAIRKARENGHLTFINTGRTLASIEDKYKEIGFLGYISGCGTAVYEENKCIYKHVIPREVRMKVIQKARKTQVTAVYEGEAEVYFDKKLPRHPVVDRLVELIGVSPVEIEGNPEEITFDKFCVWLTEGADFDTFYQAIRDDFTFIKRGELYEILPKGLSKATGIQKVMELYHIALEDCIAIGDSANDLSMLQFVPNSVAMGNASEEILPYCAYQTDRVENDGLAKALEHYGVI